MRSKDKRDQKIVFKKESITQPQHMHQVIVYRHLHEIVDDESFDVFFKNTYTNVRIDCYLFYPYLEKFFRYFKETESIEFDFGNIKDDDLSHVFFKRMRVSGSVLLNLKVLKIKSLCLEEYNFDVFKTLHQLQALRKLSLTSVEINNQAIHADFAIFFVSIPQVFKSLTNLKISLQTLTYDSNLGSVCYLISQLEDKEQSINDGISSIKKIKLQLNDSLISREFILDQKYRLVDADQQKDVPDTYFRSFIILRKSQIIQIQISNPLIMKDIFLFCKNLQQLTLLINGDEYNQGQGNLIEQILDFSVDNTNYLESLSIIPKHRYNMLYKFRQMGLKVTENSRLIFQKAKEILKKNVSKNNFYLNLNFAEVVIEVNNHQNKINIFFLNYWDEILADFSDLISIKDKKWTQLFISVGRSTQDVSQFDKIADVLNLSAELSNYNQTLVLIDSVQDLEQWRVKLPSLNKNVHIILDFSSGMFLLQSPELRIQTIFQFITCKCNLLLTYNPILGPIVEDLRRKFNRKIATFQQVTQVTLKHGLPLSFDEKIMSKLIE